MDLSEDINRNIIFITGSNYSGKSLLGHILSLNEDFLYNYSSISPDAYFDIDGSLSEPKHLTLQKLIENIKNICHNLNGGQHKYENERWLRNDYLFNYDYINFEKNLIKHINKNIKLYEFYLIWDYYLRLYRLDGNQTKFTIFEIENTYEYKAHIIEHIQNAKFIDVLRNPIDQINSQKVDMLMRGPKKLFSGALSSKNNIYMKNLAEIVEQYKNYYLSSNDNYNYYISLENLKNINQVEANNLASFIKVKNYMSLSKHIIKSSKLKVFKNNFVNFKSSNRSYYLIERQQHHNLNINKQNISSFSYRYERRFYNFINSVLSTKTKIQIISKSVQLLFSLPWMMILSLLLGFKDLYRPFNLYKRIIIRLNSFKTLSIVSFKILSLFLSKIMQNSKNTL